MSMNICDKFEHSNIICAELWCEQTNTRIQTATNAILALRHRLGGASNYIGNCGRGHTISANVMLTIPDNTARNQNDFLREFPKVLLIFGSLLANI